MLYRDEPKLSLLVQVQATVITLIQRMQILQYAMIRFCWVVTMLL